MSGKMKIKVCVSYEGESECDSATEKIKGNNMENRVDYGIEMGARYHLNHKTSIIGTYYYGLNNISEDEDIFNRSFQIYATYAL